MMRSTIFRFCSRQGLQLHKKQIIHHYQQLTSLVLDQAVLQLFMYQPLSMLTPEDALIVKAGNRQRHIFCLRFSSKLEEMEDQIKVTRWINVPLTFDETSALMFMQDQPQQMLIIEKETKAGPLRLYGQARSDSMQLKLITETSHEYHLQQTQYATLVTQMKQALPIVFGWRCPSKFIKLVEFKQQS